MMHATLGHAIDRRRAPVTSTATSGIGNAHPCAHLATTTQHTTPPEAGNVHLDLIDFETAALFEGRELLGALLMFGAFLVAGLAVISFALGFSWVRFLSLF